MDFKDLLTSRNIIIFIIVLILIVAIFYYTRRRTGLERFTNSDDTMSGKATPTAASGAAPFKTYQTTGLDKPDASAPVVDRTPTNPNDLLPSTTGANWGNLYPVQNDGGVYVPSMIDPSFSIGINTISNTLKNPSLDLRSEFVIPKQVVSPFLNSSYEPNISKIGLDPTPSIIA
jgi:hypothetical protein